MYMYDDNKSFSKKIESNSNIRGQIKEFATNVLNTTASHQILPWKTSRESLFNYTENIITFTDV